MPNFTTRLHELVQRVGEICLSPELAHIMLFPTQALSHQACLSTPYDFPKDYQDLCRDHTAILDAMHDLEPHHTADAGKFLACFQADCLPPPAIVKFRQPIHLCAWRIESPTRTLLLLPSSSPTKPAPNINENPLAFKPHQLPKHLLDERSKRPQPSAIHLLLPNDADLTSQAVRDSLLHHIKASPTSFVAPPTSSNTSDTTLEEAACVFTAGPASNHSEIQLNQSPPWEKDHIDSRLRLASSHHARSYLPCLTSHLFLARYAETQTATNGIRYRDWLCVYASDETIEKCKLEGHVLDITSAHQAFVPWKRQQFSTTTTTTQVTQPATEWCVSRSSLPLEQRILHDRPPANAADRNISRFTAFTRSVKSRLLQDLKLLPLPSANPDFYVVQRHNVSVYTDEIAQQVLVVYSPTSLLVDSHPDAATNTQLEFVCFTLLPPTVSAPP